MQESEIPGFLKAHLERPDLELELIIAAASFYGDIGKDLTARNVAHRTLKSAIDRSELKALRQKDGSAYRMSLIALDDLDAFAKKHKEKRFAWLSRFVKRWKLESEL